MCFNSCFSVGSARLYFVTAPHKTLVLFFYNCGQRDCVSHKPKFGSNGSGGGNQDGGQLLVGNSTAGVGEKKAALSRTKGGATSPQERLGR